MLDWSNPPFAKWFADGELNVAYNCLDRHVEAGNGDRVALLWEGEPGDERRVTYAELTDEVKRLANVLTDLGIGEGDRVAIYLPMIPEAIAAMLAVARVGAIHSVVFGGFSADSLRARIDDAGAKLVITADGGYRKGKVSPLKPAVDMALADRNGSGEQETVEHVLVVRRGGNDVDWVEGRDIWWHDVVPAASADHEAQALPRRDTRSSSSTRPARPVSRRASCTRRAATSPRPHSPTGSCTTSTPRPTSTGAPPTSAGSPATPT